MQPGQSLELDKVFTLEDLEQQFGETLLEKFRHLFQLFVHRNSAPPPLLADITALRAFGLVHAENADG